MSILRQLRTRPFQFSILLRTFTVWTLCWASISSAVAHPPIGISIRLPSGKNVWARAVGEAIALRDVTEDMRNRVGRLFPGSSAASIAVVQDEYACRLREAVKGNASVYELQRGIQAFAQVHSQLGQSLQSDPYVANDRALRNYLRSVCDRFDDLKRDLSKCKIPYNSGPLPPVVFPNAPHPRPRMPHNYPATPGYGQAAPDFGNPAFEQGYFSSRGLRDSNDFNSPNFDRPDFNGSNIVAKPNSPVNAMVGGEYQPMFPHEVFGRSQQVNELNQYETDSSAEYLPSNNVPPSDSTFDFQTPMPMPNFDETPSLSGGIEF